MSFCRLLKKIHELYQSVKNGLDSDQAQRSVFRLFAKIFSRHQKSPLAGKELIQPMESNQNCRYQISIENFFLLYFTLY